MAMPEKVKKRDGRVVKFDQSKITEAIYKAAESVDGSDRELAEALAGKVTEVLEKLFTETVPTIEDVQDTVEKVLIDSGHSRTAKSFILYRKKRDEIRAKTKVRKVVKKKASTTDKHLLVDSDASMEYQEWNKARIADSLVNEKGIQPDEAAKIASIVEKRVIQSGVSRISLSLIRELVNNELFERGYTELLERQTLVGLTVSEMDDIIHSKSKENANITANNPEAINLALSEFMLKQYALNKVFTQDVADAHRDGTVHLHDLGMPTRAYCSGHSLEYLKMYGLDLWTMDTKSSPAKHANTLTGHLNTFLSNMQAYYAGALGLGAVNVFYAPYLEDATDKEISQVAQYMIFSGAQNCFSKGGQSLFLDFNLNSGVPSYLKDVPAVGPCGKYTGRTYSSYEKTAQRIAIAMLKVWKDGDSNGNLFQFPKCHDKDTLVYAEEDGIRKIMSIGDILSSFDGGSVIKVPHYDTVAGSKMEWVNVKDAAERGVEDGIEVRLSGYKSIKTTKDHQYPVFDGENVIRVEAEDLKKGDILLYRPFECEDRNDYVVINAFDCLKEYPNLQVYNVKATGTKWWQVRDGWIKMSDCDIDNLTGTSYITGPRQKDNKMPITFEVTEDFARFLGYFLSEGCYTGNNIAIATIPTSRHRESILNAVKTLNSTYFENGSTVTLCNVLLKRTLQKVCPTYTNHASQKAIPDCIFQSKRSVVEAFIASLWHGDGTIKNDFISYSTSSEQLAYGLCALLSQIGIYASVYTETRKNYPGRLYYNVAVKGFKQMTRMNDILKDVGMSRDNGNEDATDTSWSNSIPTKCAKGLRECYQNREFLSRDTGFGFTYPELFNTFIPVMVESVSVVPVDSVAVEVDHPEHTFVLANGVITKNCNFHINDDTFTDPEHKKVFDYACEVAAHNGSPYFAFDRDSASQSACCRLRFTIEDEELLKHPERQRFCGFQNVTVNLPQCAYRAGKGKIRKLYAEIDKAMDICLKAHLQKKAYIAGLMSAPNLPLWQLGKIVSDGKPYVELDKCTYIIGMIGLNECVQYLLGKELHEDDETLKAGLRIISHMFYTVKEFGEKYGLKFTLEESPAESASRRFARIDLKKFPESVEVVKGDIEKDECYYTNSIHLRADCNVDLVQRIVKQAKFHNLIESGAIIHAFVGENRPSAKSIAKLVEMTYRKTNAAQITISPEFTICNRCKKMIPGMSVRCQSCGAENITGAKRKAASPDGTWTKENIERFQKGKE